MQIFYLDEHDLDIYLLLRDESDLLRLPGYLQTTEGTKGSEIEVLGGGDRFLPEGAVDTLPIPLYTSRNFSDHSQTTLTEITHHGWTSAPSAASWREPSYD